MEVECNKIVHTLEETAKLAEESERLRKELEEDTSDFLDVGLAKLSNLSKKDLSEYKPTGITPAKKPLSSTVALVRTKPHEILREEFKQVQQQMQMNTDDGASNLSSPRKRKKSDGTASGSSSGRSSTESMPNPPAVAAKKQMLASKENNSANNLAVAGPPNKTSRSRSPLDKNKPAKENKQPLAAPMKKVKSISNMIDD